MISSDTLNKLLLPSLRCFIPTWNHHRSALQGMRLPEKYQVNHLQPLFPIYHLLGLVNRSLHRLPFPQGGPLYVSIYQCRVIPDHRFHIAPPTVSWFTHEHLHEMSRLSLLRRLLASVHVQVIHVFPVFHPAGFGRYCDFRERQDRLLYRPLLHRLLSLFPTLLFILTLPLPLNGFSALFTILLPRTCGDICHSAAFTGLWRFRRYHSLFLLPPCRGCFP